MAFAPAAPAEANAEPMKFGTNRASVDDAVALGIRPDYAQFWAGVWNERSGWSGFTSSADRLADQGVMPLVEWWYWGDSISPECVQNGCIDDLHGDVRLSASKWRDNAVQLAKALHAGLQGRPGAVVIESEFNKNGISDWETFDGMLAEHARIFREHAPELMLYLGFGNWGSSDWDNFDRAVAAMDGVGFQTMRGSTRDTESKYLGAVGAIKNATLKLRAVFPGKPVLLHDLALSSYPEMEWAYRQERVVRELFARLPELRDAGLEGIVYRTMKDNGDADTDNYYRMAERYWGFKRTDGSAKPALDDWVAGIRAAREANAAPVASFMLAASGLTATADGSGSTDPDGDALTYAWSWGDGATSTGARASHAYAAAGTYTVTLRVRDGSLEDTASKAVSVPPSNRAPSAAFQASASGLAVALDASASSDPDGDPLSYRWDFGDGGSGSGVRANHTYARGGNYTVRLTASDGALDASASKLVSVAPPAAFAATFAPKGTTNNWWVEVAVEASAPLAKAEAREDDGAWIALSKTSWGTWAKSFHVEDGHRVQFRATATDGGTALSAPYTWGDAPPPPPPPPPPLDATFEARSETNNWWIEVAVEADAPLARVEAREDDGAWVPLAATSWGTWAESWHVEDGHRIQFRATATDGRSALSTTYTWGGAAPPPEPEPSLEATFRPKGTTNNWWVEVAIDASAPLAEVEAREDDGAWIALSRTSWGTWAKSFHVEDGHRVQFRATATDGRSALSATYTWS